MKVEVNRNDDMSKVVTVHGHTLELDMGTSATDDVFKDCVIPATTI